MGRYTNKQITWAGIILTLFFTVLGWPRIQERLWPSTPVSEEATFQVRVESEETGAPISGAKVTLEMGGGFQPVVELAGTDGYASFDIESSRVGKRGRLIVESKGYGPEDKPIDLFGNELAHIVSLKPSISNTPTILVSASPTPSEPTMIVAPTQTRNSEIVGPTQTRNSDGMVMVYVPSGTFLMGSNNGEADERPVHEVTLNGFWIDRTEVTNEQYAQCVNAGQCSPPTYAGSKTRDEYFGKSEYVNYPVIFVEWVDAANYCRWVGAQLPTEAQWEYAARGPDAKEYPWGNEFDPARLNSCDINCSRPEADRTGNDTFPDTSPVGSFPNGASWVGALDMAGNVWEWCMGMACGLVWRLPL
jgi:formylglycine-generating enzyme required for sulfatase activity